MTRGSGFSLGPGYRFHIGDIFVDLSGGYSIKDYKAIDANVRWLRAYDDRVELWTNYRFEDFPQEDFFGMGLDSAPEARTSYDFDGHEVLRRLRADKNTAHIPCLALSANAMPEDIERALAAGFADYWTKPIDLKAFMASMGSLFGVNGLRPARR